MGRLLFFPVFSVTNSSGAAGSLDMSFPLSSPVYFFTKVVYNKTLR